MGVLIVVATTVLVVVIARRLGGAGRGAGVGLRCCWTSRRGRGSRQSPPRATGWRCSCRAAGPDRVVLVDPRSGCGGRADRAARAVSWLELACAAALEGAAWSRSPSSRGPGHRPLTAATRVRIPQGTPPYVLTAQAPQASLCRPERRSAARRSPRPRISILVRWQSARWRSDSSLLAGLRCARGTLTT